MERKRIVAGALAVVAVAAGGFVAADQTGTLPIRAQSNATSQPTVPQNCETWGSGFTQGECLAAGTIRFVGLYNLQGAGQFCKWQVANPGEWARLQSYAQSNIPATNIVTWFGNSIQNELQAYFATGAPSFAISPNTAPNRCRTPLRPPIVSGVTPGQTDATVTVTTTP